MKIDMRALLEECIDQGVHHAILNYDHVIPFPAHLEEKIYREVWLKIDSFIRFEYESE